MFKSVISYMLCFAMSYNNIVSADIVRKNSSKFQLIPRNILFAKPDKFCVRLSPNGHYISYFARSGSEVELYIDTVQGKHIKKFSVKNARNMYQYRWCHTNKHILLPEDNQGDENDHILCLDISTGKKTNITPFKNSKSIINRLSENFPNEVIIANNNRDAKWFDAYKINITNGAYERIFENNDYMEIIFDEKFKIRAFQKVLENGDIALLNPDSKEILKIPFEESSCGSFYHFKKNGNILYASYPLGQDKSSLIAIDFSNGKVTPLLSSDVADVRLSSCDPRTFEPQLATVSYLKKQDIPINKTLSKNLKILQKKFADKEFYIQGRSKDDSKWLIVTEESNESIKYYLFDTTNKTIKFLFSNQPALDRYRLQKMEPVVIKSRDGLDLVCYLTRPANQKIQKVHMNELSSKDKNIANDSISDKSSMLPAISGNASNRNQMKSVSPAPLVAYIHGGPWARDNYGLDKMAQFLSNRGYAVLQINYRGSEGFGKKFLNAINRNLEGVRNDIIDAIQWAIDQGIADKNKIAIMGGSFGGYSTLAGLAYTPDFFCCGVDVVGPSNFISLLSSVPEYWKPFMITWYKTAGDPSNPDDLPYLKSISPLFRKDQIKKPLLVFQGENDPRVKKAESDQIVAALKAKNHPVAYVLYPDEGHGFHREPNIMSYIAFTEKFLSKTLGGWFEPFNEKDLEGSSHKILEGDWLSK